MQPHNNKNREYRLPGLIAAPEGGFALIAAIMACVVLLALGMLVIHLSTQDLRVSARLVGDKKALSAVTVGFHAMALGFDPTNLNASAMANVPVDAADPATKYTIGTPTRPATGPETILLAGYGPPWGAKRYDVVITGQNTDYSTRVDVTAGIGYGPVDIGSEYK